MGSDHRQVIKVEELLPHVLPDLRSHTLSAEFETEVVVWAKGTKRAHHLSGLAAIVFDACDGVTRAEDLISEVAEATETSHDQAIEAVTRTWRELIGSGLMP